MPETRKPRPAWPASCRACGVWAPGARTTHVPPSPTATQGSPHVYKRYNYIACAFQCSPSSHTCATWVPATSAIVRWALNSVHLTMPSVVSPLSRARKALHSPNAKPNRQPSLSTRARMETKPVLTVRASTSMPPVQSKVPSMHNGSTSLLFEAGGSAIVIGVSCTLMGAAVDRSTGMAAGGFRATAALGFADEEGATLASARAGVGLALKDVGNTLPSMSSNVDQTNPLGGSGSTNWLSCCCCCCCCCCISTGGARDGTTIAVETINAGDNILENLLPRRRGCGAP